MIVWQVLDVRSVLRALNVKMRNTCMLQAPYNWMFYVGVAPTFLSFFAVSVLSHYDNWDPVYLAIRKTCQCILRRRLIPRYSAAVSPHTQV